MIPVGRGWASAPDGLLHANMRVRVSHGSGKACASGAHGLCRSALSTLALQHGDPARPHTSQSHTVTRHDLAGPPRTVFVLVAGSTALSGHTCARVGCDYNMFGGAGSGSCQATVQT